MRRFLPVMCLLAFVVSCGTKDDNESNNSTNNANNNTNNLLEDVGTDTPEPDAGLDTGDLGTDSDAESDMVLTTTCLPTTSAPYTLPATSGASITFDFECDVPTTAPDLRSPEIAYEITFPDGSTSSGITSFQIGDGTISATITVEPREFVVGQATVKFSSTHPDLKFDEAITGQFVFHQTVDEVNQNWKGLVSFDLVQPTPTAQLLEQRPGDYNADGVVDVLAVWRYDHAIGVQVLSGPDFIPGAVSEVFVGPDVASTLGQGIRIGYAKGASDDTALGLHWYGLNNVDKSVDIASVVLTNGVPGQVTRYSTADYALPGPTAILGVDLVDEGNLQAGDATELTVLYAGLNGPKESFLTVQTSKRDNKLGLVSQQDHLGGVTPTQAASSVHVGLMRGLDASHDPRQAADPLKMTAWTLGDTTTLGQPEFRRIGLRGAELGLTQSAWNVSLQPGETGFQVEVLQSVQEPYVVLTSVQDPSQVPTIRAWKMVGNVAESPKTYQTGVDALATEWHAQLQTYKNTRVREHRPRLVTSDEYPFYAQLAAAKGLPATRYFGVGFDLGQAFGPLKKFEPIYSLDTEAAVLKSIATQGGGSTVSVGPDDSISSGSTRTGSSLSKRAVDDAVVVASHPNGTVLKATNHAVGAPGNKTTVDTLIGKGPLLGLFEVPSNGSTYLIQSQGDDTQWLYQVYRVDGADLIGPATIKVSKAHGAFQLMSHSGEELAFMAESGDAEVFKGLKGFTVAGAELENAAQTMATFEIGDAAIKGLGGVSQPRAARLKYGAEAARVHAIRSTHNNERRQKADLKRDLLVGAVIAPGAQETYAVMGNDDADECKFETNLFVPNTANPVRISEATMDGCWDLHVPVATADFCGVGGSQVMTVAVVDTSSRTAWTWQALLWMRMGDRLMATEFGTFQLAPGVAPQTTATDFNGDGLVDLLISSPVSALNGPLSGASLVLLGDGLGGNLGPASLDTFTDVFDVLPNAGDGLGAGQVACGAGLQCQLGTGTRTSYAQASTKAELL